MNNYTLDIKTESDLFITLYKFNVIDHKYLKNIFQYYCNHAICVSSWSINTYPRSAYIRLYDRRQYAT